MVSVGDYLSCVLPTDPVILNLQYWKFTFSATTDEQASYSPLSETKTPALISGLDHYNQFLPQKNKEEATKRE